MTVQIPPIGPVPFRSGPGETVTVTLKLDTSALEAAVQRVVEWAEAMAPAMDAARNVLASWSQPREVYVAGLEARYYVRGGLDSRYREPEARDALVRRLMHGEELPPPCLLDHHERAQVAAGFLTGWMQGQGKGVPLVCRRVCEYAVDVGVPEYSALPPLHGGCGNCEHYLIP